MKPAKSTPLLTIGDASKLLRYYTRFVRSDNFRITDPVYFEYWQALSYLRTYVLLKRLKRHFNTNTMKTDISGTSKCLPGQELYETFNMSSTGKGKGKTYVQYDFRHTNGELFSIVAPTIEQARSRKLQWLKTQATLFSKLEADYKAQGYVNSGNPTDQAVSDSYPCPHCEGRMNYIGLKKENGEIKSRIAIMHCNGCGCESTF